MKLLVKFVWKYKTLLLLLILTCIGSVTLQLWNTSFVARVTNETVAVLGGKIEDTVFKKELLSVAVRMLLIIIGIAGCAIMSGFFAGKISVKVAEDMRNRFYEKSMRFSMKEMDHFSIPSMITRCTNDVLQVRGGLYLLLTTALPIPFLIVGGIIGVIQYKLSMVWIVILGVVLVILLFFVLIRRAMPLYRRMAGELDGLNRVTREGLSGVQVLRALNRETWSADRMRDASGALKETATKTGLIETVMEPGMYLVLNLLNLIVVLIGGKNVSTGSMQVGDISAFINYLYMIISGMIMGALVGLQVPRVMIGMRRIGEVLSAEVLIRDGKGVDVSALPDYDVSFENVSFRYSEDSGNVVRNVSFTAKQGDMTVIVGNTGCGKTTLMQLIPRLYDAGEGCVRIGGVDVRDMKLDELRSLIGYVPQKSFLYRGTIRSNIAYRDQMAADEEVNRAAELSQSMAFIREKDKGLAEWIAQGGSNVSGGQRQRLAIARALVGSPKVLVMDDSASALDLETGLKLRDAICGIKGDITVLFVTQRLSFLRIADRIIVMQDGEVRDVGTHAELKETSKIYQDILQSQMGA